MVIHEHVVNGSLILLDVFDVSDAYANLTANDLVCHRSQSRNHARFLFGECLCEIQPSLSHDFPQAPEKRSSRGMLRGIWHADESLPFCIQKVVPFFGRLAGLYKFRVVENTDRESTPSSH